MAILSLFTSVVWPVKIFSHRLKIVAGPFIHCWLVSLPSEIGQYPRYLGFTHGFGTTYLLSLGLENVLCVPKATHKVADMPPMVQYESDSQTSRIIEEPIE